MIETRYRIRATQVDQLGHLNNGSIFNLFEWARWEAAEAGQLVFDEAMWERGVGPVLVTASAEFRKEIRFHEWVTIHTQVEKLVRKKFVILQELFREDGELAAVGHFEGLLIDRETRKVVPLPEDVLAWAREEEIPVEL